MLRVLWRMSLGIGSVCNICINDPDEPEGCDEFTASVMYYKIPKNTIKRVHHWMEKWGKWYIYSSGKVKMAPSITPMEFPSAVQHTASPLQTRLLHNYPDPFNPETWIPYELADDANVSIDIYNVNGGLVRHLMIGQQPSGSYIDTSKAAYWNGKDNNGTDVASGVYFYTLTAVGTHRGSDFSQTKRLVILK